MNVVSLVQGTPEWRQFRLAGIGGSDAPVVSGDSPYRSPLMLFNEKALKIVDEEEDEREFIFAKGHKMEKLIRQQFAELTGSPMDPLCAIHDKHDHVRGSFDGFDGKKYGVLEAKYVGKGVLEDARDLGEIPRHHWVQIQHNVEIAGVDLGQWFGHNGDHGVLIEVKRDAKFIREQLEREHEFWERIKTGNAPALTKLDELTPADLKLLEDLAEAKRLCDNAEAAFEELKEKLDSYGHPRLRGAGLVCYKSSRQGSIDVKKIPGIKTLLESYTERYLEKFRGAPSKESWTVRAEKKGK